MTALEEKQIELEKKLKEEKKQVLAYHLKKTIEDNKQKIIEKKEQLKLVKIEEVKEMSELREDLAKDTIQVKESKLKKKYEMKNMMQKQLAEVAKKVEDA